MPTVTAQAIVWNTTAGNKTTASFTPPAGSLLVAVVGIGGVDAAPTMSDSLSGSWTLVDVFRSYGAAVSGGLRVYVRTQPATGASMTVTMTEGTNTGGGLAVLSVENGGPFGDRAIRSTGGQADAATGTPAPVLSLTPLVTSAILVAVMTNTNGSANCAPRTAVVTYAENYDQGFNTPPSGIEVQSVSSGETAATLTLGAATPSGFAAIAIEIASFTGPVVPKIPVPLVYTRSM